MNLFKLANYMQYFMILHVVCRFSEFFQDLQIHTPTELKMVFYHYK